MWDENDCNIQVTLEKIKSDGDNDYKFKLVVVNNSTDQEFEFVHLEKATSDVGMEGRSITGGMMRFLPSDQNNDQRDDHRAWTSIFNLRDFKNCKLTVMKTNGDIQKLQTILCDDNKQITKVDINLEKKNEPMKYKLITITFDKNALLNGAAANQ